MKHRRLIPPGFALLLAVAGCVSVDVKPIHITVDVNVKVDKALDDFFGDLDKKSATIHTPQS
jgi:hypothetical protein